MSEPGLDQDFGARMQQAIAFADSGYYAEAESILTELSESAALSAECWAELGYVKACRGRVEDGVKDIAKATALAEDGATLRAKVATRLRRVGRYSAARRLYIDALASEPNSPDLFAALGNLSMETQAPRAAVHYFVQSLRHRPDDPVVLTNLGAALTACRRFKPAEHALSRAITLKPDLPEAFINMGAALHGQDRPAASIEAFSIAERLGGRDDHVAFNLATAFEQQGDLGRTAEYLNRAITLNANHAEAHRNLGILYLSSGQWSCGWPEYEWRLRCPDQIAHARPFRQPRWDGQDIAGKILVWGEQGIGDEILYASMIPELVARGLNVVVEADRRLTRLLTDGIKGVEFVERQSPANPALMGAQIAAQIPMASLGGLLRSNSASFPTAWAPYLKADGRQIEHFRRRLKSSTDQPVVALSWRSHNPTIGAAKSVPLSELAPLLSIEGLQWVDVQYGEEPNEREQLSAMIGPRMRQLTDFDPFNDINALAAVLASCDIVVTASNVVAHLAGAMGLQTIVLVPQSTSKLWYWGLSGDQSPWYPTVHIVRQKARRSWQQAIETVSQLLMPLANHPRRQTDG